ncbi:Protein of unknown function [Bacillus thuringiensis]|uniref:Uncharacterized protein n=2 Tax=Bacillus cereus group TaxID=86661 RepID=A0A1C4CRA9_BACTU|nr:Protein of unknown function [Bacillus thuringiensis]SCC31125.1 Protein of unknown function [Bacillus wiedmannii]
MYLLMFDMIGKR